jgi:predicted ATPase
VAVQKGLTPLVGRESELGFLQQHWEQAKAGAGQVVLVSGDPGIGKSRLVQEFTEQLKHEGVTRLEFRCSPYHHNSAFYPIIEHLQRLLQFERDDTPQAKLTKLQQALVAYHFPQADTFPLLAALLSLPQPEGYPPLTLSPQKQTQRTHEALVAWIVEEAERAPVSCVWEDLQWADPSTLEVLTLYLEQIPTTRIFTMLTFRSDFTPPWGSRSYLTPLTLSRLGHRQVREMVGYVAARTSRPSTSSGRTESAASGEGLPVRAEPVEARTALPDDLIDAVVARTDGVPLFVEELTKSVVESVGAHGRAPLQSLDIPATLQDSLMARLDRLGPAKEIAQLGATLGREFSYDLLQAVSPLDEERLQQGLKQLVAAELVYQRGLVPQAYYLFKHALIQDTAYQSLLKSTRQQYHTKIAQVLDKRFPETKEAQPELLAHHYTEAGLKEQATVYWQRAGQRAVARSANREAISHLTRGLELLKTLPDTSERAQHELTLQLALGTPLMVTKGWATPEVERAYTRARELCQQVGETSQLFPALWGLWMFYFIRAELQTARELGEQLLSLAQSVQDPALVLEGHHALWPVLCFLGELAPTRVHLEQGLALYDLQQHGSLAFFYGGHDPGACCRYFAGVALWLMGYPDQALKKSHEALTLAQEVSHPYSLAMALDFATRLHQFRREWPAVQERAEAMIALSSEQGFALTFAWGTIMRGWVLAEQGQGEEGIAQMRQGLAACRATGAELTRPFYLTLLAEAYGKVGQVEEGLQVLAEALDAVDKSGERFCEAELYRLKGELTLAQSSVQSLGASVQTEAAACFLKAIEVARKQQAKSWELRAAMSLARLWQQQDKKDEARQMLAEIYGWFTEGFDTKDLQEAKALLEELSH